MVFCLGIGFGFFDATVNIVAGVLRSQYSVSVNRNTVDENQRHNSPFSEWLLLISPLLAGNNRPLTPDLMQRFVQDWKGLTSIGQVITATVHQGQETSQLRHYISSRPAKVKEFATSIRGHWQIESMHWVLDVVLGEDDSPIRNGDGAENFGCLRKFVLSLLKRDTSEGSLKRKRAAWSTKFLESLLFE